MQSSVTTLASLLERTFPAGLSGLIFDCDGVMVDSRDVNIGYYNLLLREVGKPPITPEQAGYVQMSTAKEALEYIFSPEELKLLPAIAERYRCRRGTRRRSSLAGIQQPGFARGCACRQFCASAQCVGAASPVGPYLRRTPFTLIF